ncbi:Retrovirus-related Pol polyprotein from transposon opus [Lucilia cuprina]|nr:Retrovirus-related Pol polyprotein from transposon opus [Lucilia cuprina]
MDSLTQSVTELSIKIYTDHQPLTFALGNRNHNAKLNRWKARIEEYNHELIYKPGKSNVVADALSRLRTTINMLNSSDTDTASEGNSHTITANERNSDTITASEVESSGTTMHSAEQDATDLIPHVEAPLNVFKNQLVIREGKELYCYENPQPGCNCHYITLKEIDTLPIIVILKNGLNPAITNGIKIPETRIQLLKNVFVIISASIKSG